MACLSKGLLNAYVDGELDDRTIRRISKHLKGCASCRDMLETVKETTYKASNVLNVYKDSFNDADFKIPESIEPAGGRHINKNKAQVMMAFAAKYRKSIAATAVCLTVMVCFAVQPVRALISDALKVFRVQSVKSFSLSLQDIEQIRNKLEFENNVDFALEDFGSFAQSGFESLEAAPGDMSKAAGFRLLAPHDSEGFKTRIDATGPGRIEFTLFTENINNVLKMIGATRLLPDAADGKKIVAEFGSVVSMTYSGDDVFMIEQSTTPSVSMPSDVDEDEFYACLVQLPIWPDNIKSRLSSIKDWKNTIYIPVVGNTAKDVVIRGCSGIAWENTEKSQSCAAWMENGVLIAVNGSCPIEKTMEFIDGLEVSDD